MRLDFDQKEIGIVPLNLLDNFLNKIDDHDWYEDDYRKSADGMKNTNSIPLLHSSLCFLDPSINAINTIEKRKLYSKYEEVLLPIVEILRKYYFFHFYSVFIAKLNPRSIINPHKDKGSFLRTCHRVHVPLKTNKDVEYIIEQNSFYWQKGFIYEFDNTRVHGVKNNSDQERIHLVFNLYNLTEKDLQDIKKIEENNPNFFYN